MATRLPYPYEACETARSSELIAQFVNDMTVVHDRMDEDLERLGIVYVPSPHTVEITTLGGHLNRVVDADIDSSNLSYRALGNTVRSNKYGPEFIRIAQAAATKSPDEESAIQSLYWVQGLATTTLAAHTNYMGNLARHLRPALDMPVRHADELEIAKANLQPTEELVNSHQRHYIERDWAIVDTHDEQAIIARVALKGLDTKGAVYRPKTWTGQVLRAVGAEIDRISLASRPVQETAVIDPRRVRSTVDRRIKDFKDIEKDPAVRELVADLTRGLTIHTSENGRKVDVNLPTVPKPTAKEVARLVSSYNGDLDELVTRVRDIKQQDPEASLGDDSDIAALDYLATHIDTVRKVASGGKTSATKPWSSLVK